MTTEDKHLLAGLLIRGNFDAIIVDLLKFSNASIELSCNKEAKAKWTKTSLHLRRLDRLIKGE